MMSVKVFLLVQLFCLAVVLSAQAEEKTDYKQLPLPEKVVPADATVGTAALVCFLEGPAVDAAGNIYFSDIAGSRILKSDPDGKVIVFREDAGRTNGNTFDAQGRLISCEGAEMGPGGRRRVTRTDLKTGKVEVLTDKYAGKRYNSPNDVVVDTNGRIWFTDPLYSPDKSNKEMEDEAVYRIDPDGKVTRILTQPQIHKPNGIAITPDAKTLYVVDSNPAKDGNRKIWSFAVADDGSLSKQKLIWDFGKARGGDGMRLDTEGNLWIAAGVSYKRSEFETTEVPPGVYVVSPDGKMLGRIPIVEDLITNLAFGGPDRKTLYVTAGKTLYKVPVKVQGYALYPPLK
ncbi:MAG: SMP-30/gluconolactonase/LRE family protein [Gemmataceae bacterium]